MEGTKRGACPGGPARARKRTCLDRRSRGKKPPAAGSAQSGGAAGGVRRRALGASDAGISGDAGPAADVPAVKDGDLVLGIRLGKRLCKNDVVVYERSGRVRVGRVCWPGRGHRDPERAALWRSTARHRAAASYPTYPKSLLSYPTLSEERLHSGRLPHTGRGQP